MGNRFPKNFQECQLHGRMIIVLLLTLDLPQTEHEYKPRFFDKPDCLSSNKENIPLIELVTPPSLRNLSLEEEANESENEATSWEANVARNLETMPKASSPYPRKMSTLADLELETDDDMIDVSDFLKDPRMIKGLLDQSKQP